VCIIPDRASIDARSASIPAAWLNAISLVARDMTSHSRGALRPSLAKQCPSSRRGRRECRVFVAPVALRAVKKARKQVTTGTPKHSGIPCTTVYGL
jgi:hypothetical protein